MKKLNIETDEEGNIKYPIIVHQSLKILDLGYIEFDRPNYHTATNIFPIGYKSVRVNHSAKSIGGRAEYTCEILDGGEKPLFRVTSEEDPDNSITKESTSGAWLEFAKKIESIQNQRKGGKVTVSGPDRYGIQEHAVVQLI